MQTHGQPDDLPHDGGHASKNGWLVDKLGAWWDTVPIQQMQIFA